MTQVPCLPNPDPNPEPNPNPNPNPTPTPNPTPNPDLLPRVTQTLLEALRDRRKPLSTHYGAIVRLQL